MRRPPPRSTLFPYTTLFRSVRRKSGDRPLILPTMALDMPIGKRNDSAPVVRTIGEIEKRFQIGRATSELQSHSDLVCRLLLEKKKQKKIEQHTSHQKANRTN